MRANDSGPWYMTNKGNKPQSPNPAPETQPAIGLNGLPGITSNSSASQTMAAIYRKDWEDYLSRFAPYEQKMMGLVGNQGIKDQLLNDATANVNQAFGISNSNYNSRMQNYGATSDNLQTMVHDKQTGLAKTAALVGARNGIRTQLKDTENNILAGGLGDVLKNQQGAA